MTFPRPPNWTGKAAAIAALACLALAAAAFGLFKLLDRPPASPEQPPTAFGVTDEEYGSLSLEPLIRAALARVTIDTLRAGAEAGERRAQTLLCLAYDFGADIEPSASQAARWCESAAKQDDQLARYVLGLYRREGLGGLFKNERQANELIADAAHKGDARAQFDVGNLFLVGERGFDQDDGRALDHYRRAAEQGHGPSMYEHGRGVARDYAKALQWYEKLAETGSPVGMRAVAWMHHKGHGVRRDLGKAIEGYQRALERGDPEAALLLGQMYENGEGVAIDVERAVALYRQAAAAGYGPAQLELARIEAR
jgi:uncharacterized protein